MSWPQGLWPLRILSVVIAITLWLLWSYSGREQTRTERAFDDVSITYIVPEGLLLLNPASAVSVRLNGPESSMTDLTPFQVQFSVEVSPQPGLQEIVLSEEMVSRPAEFDVVSITPSRLTIRVDEEIEKSLRVVVDPNGTEPSGGAIWLSEETTADPETIRVVGPRSQLERRDTIRAFINLQNRLPTHVQHVPVERIERVQTVGSSTIRVVVAMEGPELPSDNETE